MALLPVCYMGHRPHLHQVQVAVEVDEAEVVGEAHVVEQDVPHLHLHREVMPAMVPQILEVGVVEEVEAVAEVERLCLQVKCCS